MAIKYTPVAEGMFRPFSRVFPVFFVKKRPDLVPIYIISVVSGLIAKERTALSVLPMPLKNFFQFIPPSMLL